MAERERSLPADQQIDFVSIVTPTASHYSIARAFLTSGFHVVCDKPMTAIPEQAEALVQLVEGSGLVFALTHNYTGYPLVRHAREMFRARKMGRVRKVVVEYLQDFLMFPHEKHGLKQAIWRTDPVQAGLAGTMFDAGSHCENLLKYITGEEITELCADFSTFLPDRELEEDANLLVRLRGGGKGIITVSQIATGEENNLTIRIYGSEGAIIWSQETPNSLQVYRYSEPRQVLTRAHGEYLSAAATLSTRIPTGHPEGFLEAFANIYVGVAEAICRHIEGRPLKVDSYNFPSVYDGLRGLRFVKAAVDSVRNGSSWTTMKAAK